MIKASISDYLGRAYAAAHGLPGTKESVADVQQAFVLATKTHPELLDQLRNRLEDLSDDVCCRCYISTYERVFLTQVAAALA